MKMKKPALVPILFLFICFVFNFVLVDSVLAQNFVTDVLGGEQLIPSECKVDKAEGCGISQFIQLLVNVFRLMLGLIGSLGLFFFIYGGFILMLSRGNQTMIQKGKDIVTGSAIGITVVLGSWVIINFIIIIATGQDFGGAGQLFGNVDWSNPFAL